MNKIVRILASVLLFAALPVASVAAPKKAAPKGKAPAAIRFEGASQYTQEELLAASGAKPGARLSAAELRARAKQLNDTGFFSSVRLRADKRGTAITLAISNELYPMHLDNLPLDPQVAEGTLRQQVPLYRGLLPGAGSAVDQACAALAGLLKAKGADVTVKAALTSGVGAKKITAISFTVASPAVRIGTFQYTGVSSAMQAKVSGLAVGQHGNGYETENSVAGLERAFRDLYGDQGYLAAKVRVSQIDPLAATAEAIEVPFHIEIEEGSIYKFGAIRYPATAPVARAMVEKFLARYPAGSGRPLDLYLAAVRDAYRAKGYMDCTAVAQPVFSEATHVADYDLAIDPGTLYRFSSVRFEGVPAELLPRLQKIWTLPAGAEFDESYVSGFVALASKKDKKLGKWLPTQLATFDVEADAQAREVQCIFHFAKAAGEAK